MGKIWAIANQKGGVTKTTTTCELAAALNGMGQKVLVIDMDQQCDLSKNSNVKIENTINDVFQAPDTLSHAIQHTKHFDIIPGDPALSKAEKLYDGRDDVYLLADVCEVLAPSYDFILLDNPTARNIILIMSCIAADYVIVPTLADRNSLNGIVEIESDLRQLRNSRNKESHAYIKGIILSIYEGHNPHKKAFEEIEEISDKLEGDVFAEKVRKSSKTIEAIDMAQPMQEYQTYNNVSVDYRRIAKRMLEVNKNGEK